MVEKFQSFYSMYSHITDIKCFHWPWCQIFIKLLNALKPGDAVEPV